MGRVVPPRREQAIAMLVDHKGSQVIMLATIFAAILIMWEDVNEIVPTVIAPGYRPLASASGIVVGVLSTATISPFQIPCRVDDQASGAQTVSHRLGGEANHFADGWDIGRGKRDIGQVHL